MKNKEKLFISGRTQRQMGIKMKKYMQSVICLLVIAIFITGCGSENLEKQLSLGQKYLFEQKYEEAIVAFEKAIQIDKKCVDAYIGLADAYVGIGDSDKALEMLKQGFAITADKVLNEKYLGLKSEINKVESDTDAEQGADGSEIAYGEGTSFPIKSVEGLALQGLKSRYEGGELHIEGEHNKMGQVATLISTWWTEEEGRQDSVEKMMQMHLESWREQIPASQINEEEWFDVGLPIDDHEKGHIINVLLVIIDKEVNPVNYAIVEIDLSK